MIRIMVGHVLDRLAELPDESVHCVVTSPPYYGLRDYGIEAQVWLDRQSVDQGARSTWRGSLGLEPTPALYIEHMVAVFREVRRVLRKDGTLWLNIGDSYSTGNFTRQGKPRNVPQLPNDWAGTDLGNRGRAGHAQAVARDFGNIKPKDLLGIPWMLAFALRDDGWYLRSEITWAKKAPMPESVTDRPTSATEKVFLLAKSPRYFWDAEAVKEESVSDHDSGNGFDGRQGTADYQAKSGGSGTKEEWKRGQRRNMRNIWYLGPEPYPDAHFATFPTEIPRRAILAGTSERGVCPKCGAPWGRITKTDRLATRPGNSIKADESRNDGGRSARVVAETVTLGWRATCSCDIEGMESQTPSGDDPRQDDGDYLRSQGGLSGRRAPDVTGRNPEGRGNRPTSIPATVLDPFFGAGTTGLVADQLGRDCIGIELSPEYAEMAERRLRLDAGMFVVIAVAGGR